MKTSFNFLAVALMLTHRMLGLAQEGRETEQLVVTAAKALIEPGETNTLKVVVRMPKAAVWSLSQPLMHGLW